MAKKAIENELAPLFPIIGLGEYKTRLGKKVTLYGLQRYQSDWPYLGTIGGEGEHSWQESGRYFRGIHEHDIIGPWVEPQTSSEGGMKFDDGKPQPSLLFRGLAKPISTVIAVLTYGAKKYAADSWQTVPNGKKRYEEALDRHLLAWRLGESFDEESGLHHLSHAACNTLFLLWFEMKDKSLALSTTHKTPAKQA